MIFFKKKWEEISSDTSFYERAQASRSSFLIPRWAGSLLDSFELKPLRKNYTVIAVDGSQIYPDRHVCGAGCFLINVGGVILRYEKKSSFSFFSEPHVLLPSDICDEVKDTSFFPRSCRLKKRRV